MDGENRLAAGSRSGSQKNSSRQATATQERKTDNMKKTTWIATALVAAWAMAGTAVAVEDGLGTNHVRTLRATDGIVLNGQKITEWTDVSSATLTNGSVTAAKLNTDTAGNGLTKSGAGPLAVTNVVSSMITDGTIVNGDIADAAAISPGKIAGGAMVSNAVYAGMVTGLFNNLTITNGAVITAIIADGAVNSTKILDGTIANGDISDTAAIASGKIAGGALTSNTTFSGMITGDSTTLTITNGAVVTAIIANDAVTTGKIADGAVTNTDIAATANIDPAKIAGTAITLTGTDVMTGTKSFNALVYTPSAVDITGDAQSFSAAATSFVELSASSGNRALSAGNPITGGTKGQILTVRKAAADANSIKFSPVAGIELAMDIPFTMSPGDVLQMICINATGPVWQEVSRVDMP